MVAFCVMTLRRLEVGMDIWEEFTAFFSRAEVDIFYNK
jgi:hypothetical protein